MIINIYKTYYNRSIQFLTINYHITACQICTVNWIYLIVCICSLTLHGPRIAIEQGPKREGHEVALDCLSKRYNVIVYTYNL